MLLLHIHLHMLQLLLSTHVPHCLCLGVLQAAPDAPRFLPFSIGPRNCVGQLLALVEIKVALAMLLGSIKFELTPDMGGVAGVEADAIQTITFKPEHGLSMYARHRRLL
jgi:fatty acid synthase